MSPSRFVPIHRSLEISSSTGKLLRQDDSRNAGLRQLGSPSERKADIAKHLLAVKNAGHLNRSIPPDHEHIVDSLHIGAAVPHDILRLANTERSSASSVLISSEWEQYRLHESPSISLERLSANQIDGVRLSIPSIHFKHVDPMSDDSLMVVKSQNSNGHNLIDHIKECCSNQKCLDQTLNKKNSYELKVSNARSNKIIKNAPRSSNANNSSKELSQLIILPSSYNKKAEAITNNVSDNITISTDQSYMTDFPTDIEPNRKTQLLSSKNRSILRPAVDMFDNSTKTSSVEGLSLVESESNGESTFQSINDIASPERREESRELSPPDNSSAVPDFLPIAPPIEQTTDQRAAVLHNTKRGSLHLVGASQSQLSSFQCSKGCSKPGQFWCQNCQLAFCYVCWGKVAHHRQADLSAILSAKTINVNSSDESHLSCTASTSSSFNKEMLLNSSNNSKPEPYKAFSTKVSRQRKLFSPITSPQSREPFLPTIIQSSFHYVSPTPSSPPIYEKGAELKLSSRIGSSNKGSAMVMSASDNGATIDGPSHRPRADARPIAGITRDISLSSIPSMQDSCV